MRDHFSVALKQSDPSRVDAYDYELPEQLIAAHPALEREGSRLLIAHVSERRIAHSRFERIAEALRPGDRLVLNNTKVLPGRLQVRKESGGRVELLILERADGRAWQETGQGEVLSLKGMYRASNRLKVGQLLYHEGRVEGAAPLRVERLEGGQVIVSAPSALTAAAYLERYGALPLPPYILKRREAEGEQAYVEGDQQRYQTVMARHLGAVAAPTAGLHFTPQLLEALCRQGVARSEVTLHVGPGTFKPMARQTDRLSEHAMHGEMYLIGEEIKAELEATRLGGGRLIAVGTTSARALETEARRGGEEAFKPGERRSELFLYPGHGFELCDGLITNFHLPRSTLLTLVASLTGYAFMREIYNSAIAEQYRFYSYGDAMMILP